MREVTVEAPASSANLGPGFDVFALALSEPRDRVRLLVQKSDELRVEIEQVEGVSIPLVPEANGAGVVALAAAKDFRLKAKITISIWKKVPIGVGLGSSAASAAAAVFAMNRIFHLGMLEDDMIYYAGKGEAVTSGTAHYDNVSASIRGGFVIVRAGNKPSSTRLPPLKNLAACIATPIVNLPARKTEYARSILPRTVELRSMVENVAAASSIVAGFALGDVRLIGIGMNDKVVEVARKTLIPGYDSVRLQAIRAGASGVCISGAGPSMLAIVDRRKTAAKGVLDSMLNSFKDAGVQASGFITSVGEGARVVENK